MDGILSCIAGKIVKF